MSKPKFSYWETVKLKDDFYQYTPFRITGVSLASDQKGVLEFFRYDLLHPESGLKIIVNEEDIVE